MDTSIGVESSVEGPLFDRSLFQELLTLGDEAGVKSIILRNHRRVTQFAFPEGAIDIDTSKDWEKLKSTVILNEVKDLAQAD